MNHMIIRQNVCGLVIRFDDDAAALLMGNKVSMMKIFSVRCQDAKRSNYSRGVAGWDFSGPQDLLEIEGSVS